MYSRILKEMVMVDDKANNLNRVGSIGTGEGRVWKAIQAFEHSETFETYYLMEHMFNQEEKVLVPIQRITNFY